jgi:hypothetical protein
MAITTPITGNPSVNVGATTTLQCATNGGNWSSSNTSVATVNGLGVVTGVGSGQCSIIYTVDDSSISITLTVTSRTLSNGFDVDVVYNALKNRVLWQSLGVISDSRRYFEDFHTLNNVALIEGIKNNASESTADYLENLQRSVVLNAVNAVYRHPQIVDPAKLVFFRSDWMLVPQPITNRNQFVGLKLKLAKNGDFAIKMNTIELFFDKTITFNMYLYNDMTIAPIYVKEVTTSANEQVIIDLSDDAILNNLSTKYNKGGLWYFGYYQEDIEAQGAKAIFYSVANEMFKPVWVWAYSAPMQTINGQRNFQRNNIGANNMTYGMNIEITTYVDATNNIVQNRHLYDNLIGLQMSAKIVESMIFSVRNNGTQRNIQENEQLQHLYEELNLAKPSEEIPYSVGLRKQINQEVIRVQRAFQNDNSRIIGH